MKAIAGRIYLPRTYETATFSEMMDELKKEMVEPLRVYFSQICEELKKQNKSNPILENYALEKIECILNETRDVKRDILSDDKECKSYIHTEIKDIEKSVDKLRCTVNTLYRDIDNPHDIWFFSADPDVNIGVLLNHIGGILYEFKYRSEHPESKVMVQGELF